MEGEGRPFQQEWDRDIKEKLDTFTVRFNKEERVRFNSGKEIIEQKKDSTAIKQLAEIGLIVLHDQKMMTILGALFKNKRNNSRLGISEFK